MDAVLRRGVVVKSVAYLVVLLACGSGVQATTMCPPGSGWHSQYQSCALCESLTYSPDGSQCKACPAGSYSIKPWKAPEGPKECKKCKRKEYLSSGTPDCSTHYVCEPGKPTRKKTCPEDTCFDMNKKCCAKFEAPDYVAKCISARKKCQPGWEWSAKAKTCVMCGTMTYSPDGSKCKTCPVGSYSIKPWKSPSGITECTQCKKKEFASSGTPDCSIYYVCEPGKPTQKKTCPEGTCFDMNLKCCGKAGEPDYIVKCFTRPERSSAVATTKKCKPGFGWSSKDNGCAPCGSLTYSPDGSACKTCPVGTYSILGFRDFEGAKECTSCDKKTYLGTPNCNVYYVCEPGKPTKKRQCPEGSCLNFAKKCCVRFDTPNKCVTARKKCQPGWEWSAKAKTCVMCGTMTYSPDGYKCRTCPVGSYSIRPWKSPSGITECFQCKKKEYASSGTPDCSTYYVCEPGKTTQKKTCPPGSCFDLNLECCAKQEGPDFISKCVSPQRSGAKAANKCPPGSEWNSQTKSCAFCESLTYSPDGSKCKACPAGSYSTKPWHAPEGPKECKTCDKKEYLGSATPDCSTYYVCEPGKPSQKKTCPRDTCFDMRKKCCAKYEAPDYVAKCISTDKKCPPGKEWSTKYKTCVSCGSLTYSPDGSKCRPCPAGTYSLQGWHSPEGPKECTKCDKKKFLGSATPDCTVYYMCQPGRPTQERRCPEKTCWNTEKTCCTDLNGKCPPVPKCGYNYEPRPDRSGCKKCKAGYSSPDGKKCKATGYTG